MKVGQLVRRSDGPMLRRHLGERFFSLLLSSITQHFFPLLLQFQRLSNGSPSDRRDLNVLRQFPTYILILCCFLLFVVWDKLFEIYICMIFIQFHFCWLLIFCHVFCHDKHQLKLQAKIPDQFNDDDIWIENIGDIVNFLSFYGIITKFSPV